ncbi:Translation initiation factor IF-2 [Mycena indigotica]|uniref:Translation initiation factor IF-2, mitochondrial n=1 Tax=Mycena indigotica TaxID=2126181 RepID=A0A8H6VVF1_9AGAR|nr:Translation initiation factor IF-2 [Mycena indigotica]KAF7295337.1 Translation initiation factor IF-2 [Mycena indigotica]
MRCSRKGCGTEYTEDSTDKCTYHPGAPVFHEGLKSWSCCAEVYKPVLDFDEFMKIPGCTQTDRHTSEAPRVVEAPKQTSSPTVTMTSKQENGQEVYSSVSKPKPAPSPSPAPAPAPVVVIEEEDDLEASVSVGTTCRRKGCGVAFVSNEVNRLGDGEGTVCTHHPMPPIFHEGSKGYLCCKRRVLEFDEFLKIEGCKQGRHVFAVKKTDSEAEQLTTCRMDHYQTLDRVQVSIFAKQVDKTRSQVRFEESQVSVDLYLPGSKRFMKTVELFGPIDPDASSFTFFGTKVELSLKKSDTRSWTLLERTDKDLGNIAFTFGVGGRTGTSGAKESVLDAATAAKRKVEPSTTDTNPQWTPRPNAEASSSKPRVSPARSWPSISATQPEPETRWTPQKPQSFSSRFPPPASNWSSAVNARPSPDTSQWRQATSKTSNFLPNFDNDLLSIAPRQSPLPRTKEPPRFSSTPLDRDVAPHLAPAFVPPRPPPQMRPRQPSRRLDAGQSQPVKQELAPPPKTSQTPMYLPPTPELRPASQPAKTKKSFKERGSLVTRNSEQDSTASATETKPVKVKKAWAYVAKRIEEDVYIPSTVSVGALARLLNIRLEDLQEKMYHSGMEAQSSFDHVLTSDYAVLLAEEFGRKPIVNDEAAFDLYPPPPHPNPQSLPNRPPIVTIMGHVDHGKTTLLDTLRSSSVAQGEAGGITQHIGAFSVPVPSSLANENGVQSITFLDTPGHAAFSAMRARGAHVTDIIVLVVAADDGVMPQTREVIELIKKDREKVSVVVAINKVDKPGAKIEAVQKALLVEDIHLEEMGGDIPAVHVSGLTGQGLPDLLDTISLLAEIQDIRAEASGNVFGYVLESKVVQGLGPIATVLVLRGALEPGAHIICGTHQARVRLMQDSNGQTVKHASPGMAVTVSGWKSLPNAGDEVLEASESDIKRALVNRKRKLDINTAMADVEAINASRQQERERRQAEAAAEAAGQTTPTETVVEEPAGPKELRLLIKADVSGSAEAIEGALQGIGNHLALSKVIGSSVGDITESDVMTAKAVGATIVGFSVNSNRAVEILAARNEVPIVTNTIIYRLMEQIKERVIRLLPVTYETKVLGEAKVLQLFEITVKGKKLKTVAGSRVVNGIVEKIKSARVMRDGVMVHEGPFETMRHFKKDVTELRKGTECGLNLAGFDDLRVDDVIQAFELIEKPGVL